MLYVGWYEGGTVRGTDTIVYGFNGTLPTRGGTYAVSKLII
jgi:hypothetical protein